MGTDKLNTTKNENGMVIVWLAIFIAVLVAMAGLAVDVGYMYVAKGQLQNAADAAALAGVASLAKVPPPSSPYTAARADAISIAAANRAATKPVTLESDNTNNLGADNDITFGHWDGAYTPGGTPVNAIHVVAKRTTDSPDGQVDIFLAKIFGWTNMSAAASATAALPPGSDGFFTICGANLGPCTPGAVQPTWVPGVTPSTPLILESGKDDPMKNFAWTSLLIPESSANQVSKYICGEQPYSRTCGQMIYTTLGTDTSIMRDLEAAMYDPTYDTANKDIVGTAVTGWWLIIPITDTCPAGSQGNAWDPKKASGYAKVHIISICAPGGGTACYNGSNPDKKCLANKIVIDQIGCVDCAHEFDLTGLKGKLVQ